MARAKRADYLTPWDGLRAAEDGYAVNAVVSRRAGGISSNTMYAYRKTVSGMSTIPPEEPTSLWTKDNSYAAPWEHKRYKEGDVVFFNSGIYSYLYKASPRYFGGTGFPNREEDMDGIRTWELLMDYKYSSNNGRMTDILLPCRMTCGDNGSFRRATDIYYPEESLSGDISFNDFDSLPTFTPKEDSIVIFPEEQGNAQFDPTQGVAFVPIRNTFPTHVSETLRNDLIHDDIMKINSVYQSNPYDESTYQFSKEFPVEEGGVTVYKRYYRRKGLHMAKVFAEEQAEIENKTELERLQAANAESQFFYVKPSTYDQVDPNKKNYWRKHGFSIEMWPSLGAGWYTFVPTTGLRDRYESDFSYLKKRWLPLCEVFATHRTGFIKNGGPYRGYQLGGGEGRMEIPLDVGVDEPPRPPFVVEQYEYLAESQGYTGVAVARNSAFFNDVRFKLLFEVNTTYFEYEQKPFEYKVTVVDGYSNEWPYSPTLREETRVWYKWVLKEPKKVIEANLSSFSAAKDSLYTDSIDKEFRTIHGTKTIQNGGVFSFYSYIRPQASVSVAPIGWMMG